MRKSIAAILIGTVIVGVVWTLLARRGKASGAEAGVPVFDVQQGPLVISVTESGTIQNREQVKLKSEVEGTTTILSLVEEGTYVQTGDLLIELDSSKLEDQKVAQEIAVQNAEAAFIRARENLAVAKSQASSDISKAELTEQFSREDLRKYVEGEYPQQLKEAESKITIAEEELQRAEDKLKWSSALAQEDFLSRTELEADRLAAKKAALELELTRSSHALLVDYTNKRRLAELKSDVEQASMALDRIRRKASADIVQAEADLKAKELQFRREQDKIEKMKEQLQKCRIHAPVSGMVVYATTGQGSWRGNQEPLTEGQQVRERQELIHLPTAEDMMSEVKVHESSLEKVRVGMPVRITVDALPGRSYAGTVTKIGLLPDAQMRWLNPDVKMYSTQVDIVGDTAGLKPGMSCRAEIFVERHEQVLYVPVQSVVRVGGQQVVYVQMPTGVEMRPVTTGLDNRHMIHVQAGLSTGEKVLLAPPLDAANAAALEYEDGDSLDADGAETGSVPGPAADANSAPAAPERGAARGEAAAASGTAAAPTPADAAAEGAGLSELMSKMRSLPRTERRAWMESLPAAQREQLLQQFRRTRGERGGGSDRPQGGGRQARGEGDA